ncbi:MAG TPA: RraA family protein [Candidatus Dormibacteraeota bacterium]|nr:RraA family protein [Candidatus Dormibacteraeota bacterium]
MSTDRLTAAQLEQFRRWSTCIVASAIETFQVRLPNTGFADSTIRCVFPDQLPVIGYAATARIRTSNPPMEQHTRFDYYDRTDWWQNILTIPVPRVVVVQDVDDPPGLGAFIGEVHANILLSLGCVAVITNGAVRDLTDIHHTELQLFAGNVSVSHAYAHLFDFGRPVTVGGLAVKPGDLIHGDLHGVQTIPGDIAGRVPDAARKIRQRRNQLLALRRSSDFSLEKLREVIRETNFGAGGND